MPFCVLLEAGLVAMQHPKVNKKFSIFSSSAIRVVITRPKSEASYLASSYNEQNWFLLFKLFKVTLLSTVCLKFAG